MNFALDPDRTSKPHGWIYGCFEPVEIFSELQGESWQTGRFQTLIL